MYRLSNAEFKNLKFQSGSSKWGGRRYMPYAFTENGIAMLSSVLNSEKAIEINIQIMRAFTNLRKMILYDSKLEAIIEKIQKQGFEIKNNKESVHKLAQLIKQILTVKEKKKRTIGF